MSLTREDINKRLKSLAIEYSESLKKHLGDRLVSIVLYGSVARGETTFTSDIDLLLVIKDLSQGRTTRLKLLEEAKKAMEGRLEALWKEKIYTDFTETIKTPQEAQKTIPLYLDMMEDAIILYDRGDFFLKILNKLRNRLKELGSKRLTMGKVRYWLLKPDFKPGEVFEI